MRSETAKSTPLSRVQRAREALVRGVVRGAHPCPGDGMAADRRRGQHPDLRAHRVGEDARRLPVGDRPARRRRSPSGLGPGVRIVYVSPLKALSYDIERNLRAPLKGVGGRDHGGPADGRHPAAGAPGDASKAARHPGHDPGVALPDHDLGGAGDPHGRGGGDRRRDPRGRAVEAGCAPGAHPGAALAPGDARTAARTFSGSASRLPSGRWSGSLASWSARGANARSPTPASRRSSTWRSSSRSKT